MPTLQHLHPDNPHPLCLCGCGSPNKDMSKFNQGHASKLRSAITDGQGDIRVSLGSTLPNYVIKYVTENVHPCTCCGLPVLGPNNMGMTCASGKCQCNKNKLAAQGKAAARDAYYR